jgi:sugar O-acyltransferase (sialic acid O-acetyltransferase NeuD family)
VKKLIVLGGVGKAEQIIDCIDDNRANFSDAEYDVVGLLNDAENGSVNGVPILGKLSAVKELLAQGFYFSFGIHPIGNNYRIKELFDSINIPPERLATIVSRRAFVSSSAILEPGVVVLPFAYVSLRAHIGTCSLLMAHSTVGHDSVLGPCCFVAGSATIGSNVNLGAAVSVCLGSTVIEKRQLADFAVLGAGSMLTKDIPSGEVYLGNPAKFLKKVTNKT